MKKYTLGQSKEQVMALIPDRGIKLVQMGTNKICVTRLGNEFFAFETLCPHQKTPLHQGQVTGLAEVICPLHHFRFDLHTGQVRSGNCAELKVFKTSLSEEGLQILI